MLVRKRNLVILASIPLAVLMGIAAGSRYFGPGRDYLGYLIAYEDIRFSEPFNVSRFEPGYMLSSWVSKFEFGLDFPLFISLMVILALFLKLRHFSAHRTPFLTWLFYLCCWYPLHDYTQVRLAVALAFCLVASEFFFRHQFLLFVALMGLAISFHASALVIAVSFPLVYILARFSVLVVAPIIILSASMLAIVSSVVFSLAAHLNTLVDAYSANIDGFKVNLFSGANILTVMLLLSILSAKSLRNRRDTTHFILAVSGLAIAVAFQDFPVFSHRIKEMLLVFLVPIAFPERLTKRALPQFVLAFATAGWSLYSNVSQGIIGFGS